jgi:hypothetical protein
MSFIGMQQFKTNINNEAAKIAVIAKENPEIQKKLSLIPTDVLTSSTRTGDLNIQFVPMEGAIQSKPDPTIIKTSSTSVPPLMYAFGFISLYLFYHRITSLSSYLH